MHSNHAQNLLLHQALYNKTMAAANATGLPLIVVDEALQKGKSFGEKYCNALEIGFNKGFEKIISIGTDCATLTTEILLNAHATSSSKNLIGGDDNGGFYLFALHKQQYNRNYFSSFNWCSAHLVKDIFSYFKSKNLQVPAFIQNGLDINSTNDLFKVFKEKNTASFFSLLFQLFNKVIDQANVSFKKINYLFLHIFLLRGPPSRVAISFL